MHVVVHFATRPERVSTRPHVRATVVEADAKGREGEMAVEESDALPKMS